MSKSDLANKILALEGLSNEDKSALLGLLREQKKYGLVWEDKPEDVERRLETEVPVLREVKDRAIISDNPDAPNHILIEGDNLEALTTLAYTHAGKIDVIYIDPPYNTGNKDFVYNDQYVDHEDTYRHSKWLSFISKRLRIARKLLSEEGVIFISIDDNEQAALKLLCDEVFGEDKFVTIFPRLTTKSGKTPVNYMVSHDYVLCYVSKRQDVFTGTPFEDDSYKFEDEYVATRGKYNLKQPLDCNSISYSASLDYIIEHDGILYCPGGSKQKYDERKRGIHLPKDYAWRWSKELYEFGLAQGWIVFKNGRIYTKGYLNATVEKQPNGSYGITYRDKIRKRSTIDFISNEFSNDIAKKQLLAFSLDYKFDFPKPYTLISALIQTHIGKNCTVLDFFAGSGSTLQAVLTLNAADGGKRTCILSTNNENSICEHITYKRNKRLILGYETSKGEAVAGLNDNSLRYYRTDFVGRRRTPANLRKLVELSTDMLCIKEDLYDEQPAFAGFNTHPKVYRYFSKSDKHMLIVYNEEYIDQISELIARTEFKNKIKIYVFSPNSYAWDDQFINVADKVELCAIPNAIYKAYKEVLPKMPSVNLEDAGADEDANTTPNIEEE